MTKETIEELTNKILGLTLEDIRDPRVISSLTDLRNILNDFFAIIKSRK